ncbi:Pentapeptide repeat-containing protein [Anaerovirgula multivorans]|uniref:Pentapeptide repeat-containing protein n=1 Tax=Anaerovirgula multivorans TaxID=312168 RepID=A0A239FHV4_9FIRM|nr:pentapeptide repeat-containing protein [Anaerovirgula multivorans]SNS56516.1 Pentapeptide repeat-containing protein [Anaerovirgula multivorans]
MAETALEKFNLKEVKPSLEQALKNLEEDFQQNKQQFKKTFIDSFKQICTNTKQIQQSTQPKTGFIIYHLLRTKILQHKYTYTAMAYDKDWYLKDGIPVGELDVTFIYKHYEDMRQQLMKVFRKYVLKISEPDVERIMLEQLDYFHKYVVEVIRHSLIEALETEEYMSIDKEDIFEIQAGEYYEPCDIIHMEEKEKNLLKIKNWLKQNQEQAYRFQDFRELDLSNLTYTNMDLFNTDFRNSLLNQTDIVNSLLIGTKFKNCTMKGANLMGAMINDANFEKADMTAANLQHTVAFTGVNFKDSNLTKADFTRAIIIGGDFEGADLEEAIFTEAKLHKSRFTKKQLEKCSLTQEQLEEIEIIQ